MTLNVAVNQKRFSVTIETQGDQFSLRLTDKKVVARVEEIHEGYYCVRIGSSIYPVHVSKGSDGSIWSAYIHGRSFAVELSSRGGAPRGKSTDSSETERLTARMAGRVVRVLLQPGDPVRAHQGVLVVEAMKMQNEVRAVSDGQVKEIPVREGQTVNPGDLLAMIEPSPSQST